MRIASFVRWGAGSLAALGLAATFSTGPAHADLRTTYGHVSVVFPGTDPYATDQVAVNRNIGSPYYGYAYVVDDALKEVWICAPLNKQQGTGADEYDDDGASIVNANQGGNPTTYIKLPGATLPFGVAVGPDDTVWISDLGTQTIYSAPPFPAFGNSVDAVPQVTSAGAARGISVTGSIKTGASLVVATQTPATIARFSVTAPDASTTGTSTAGTVTDFSVAPYNWAAGQGVYTATADNSGNAYVANSKGQAGDPAIFKILPDGSVDSAWSAPIPAGAPVASTYPSVTFVKDAAAAGGGYLYYTNQVEARSNRAVWSLRFAMDGTYLDGWGPTLATPPANWSVVDTVSGYGPTFATSDDLGNIYYNGLSPAFNGQPTKIFKMAPFLLDPTAGLAASAAGAVHSSPTAVDGVVYFGSNDGKLYAYNTTTGNLIPGFPVNVSETLFSQVRILGRPAVYFVNGQKKIYFTTDNGDVCRVDPDGTNLIYARAHVNQGDNDSTPAVLADGTVYIGGRTESGLGVLKLNPDLSTAAMQTLTDASESISSVAVSGNNVYVGVTGGSDGDIVVLKTSDLTPQAAGAAAGEGVTAPPYVSGSSAYVGTQAGNFYKVNSVTFAPDSTFGAGGSGKAAIGEGLPGSAFNEGNTFYVGSDHGKVWQIDGATGAFSVLYNTGDTSLSIPGVVVNRAANTLAFGVNEVLAETAAGSGAAIDPATPGAFYEVPTNVTSGPVNAQVFRGYGDFNSTPTYDSASKRFLIGSDDGNVYAFSSR